MRKKLSLAVGILAVVFLIVYFNPAKLIASLYRLDAVIFLASPLLTLAIILILGARLETILHVFNRSFGFRESLAIFAFSNLMGHISPAKSGEFIKVYLLRKRGLAYAKGLAAAIWEKMLDVIFMSLLAIVMVFFAPAGEKLFGYLGSLLLLFAVFLAAMVFLRFVDIVNLASKLPQMRKLKAGRFGFGRAFKRITRPRSMAKPILLTVVAQFFSGLRMYVIFLAMGVQVSLPLTLSIYFISLLIGILTMIPGGIGSVEASGAIFYSALLGVDPSTTVAAFLLLRFSTYIIDIPAGILSWGARGKK